MRVTNIKPKLEGIQIDSIYGIRKPHPIPLHTKEVFLIGKRVFESSQSSAISLRGIYGY